MVVGLVTLVISSTKPMVRMASCCEPMMRLAIPLDELRGELWMVERVENSPPADCGPLAAESIELHHVNPPS